MKSTIWFIDTSKRTVRSISDISIITRDFSTVKFRSLTDNLFIFIYDNRIFTFSIYFCIRIIGSEIKRCTIWYTTRSTDNIFAERSWICWNWGTHSWGKIRYDNQINFAVGYSSTDLKVIAWGEVSCSIFLPSLPTRNYMKLWNNPVCSSK